MKLVSTRTVFVEAALVLAIIFTTLSKPQTSSFTIRSDVDSARSRSILLTSEAAELREQGKYHEADALLRQALSLSEAASGKDSIETARVLNQLGMVDKYDGNFDEGEQLYVRALSIAERDGKDPQLLADLYHNLGGINHAWGRYAKGEPYARRSVEIRERFLGPDHVDVAADRAALAAILDGQGKFDEAEKLYHRALLTFENTSGHDFDVAVNLNNLAALYYAEGKLDEAETNYRHALEIKERLFGPAHIEVAMTANNLAVLCKARKNNKEARALYERALAIFERVLGASHPNTVTCRENLELLRRTSPISSQAGVN